MDNQQKVKEARRHIESVYGGMFSHDIAQQFDCELKGLLKGIYRTPDGNLSHERIERRLRARGFEKTNLIVK